LRKRRDRTIQGAGDGAEQFGFTFLHQAIRPDDTHTGFDRLLFDLQYGRREAIEALSGRAPRTSAAEDHSFTAS
jgi:hypothetical protein